MSEKFSENFWGDEDKGFDVLMDRMKTAKHTLGDLLVLFQDRASLEEEFSRKLAKLTKQSLGKDEEGTLGSALGVLKQEIEKLSKAHQATAEEIRQKLDKPLQQFFNEQRDVRKEHQNAVEKSAKAKNHQLAIVKKVEEKYRKAHVELDALKKARKEDAKSLKLQSIVKSLDSEYQSGSDKLRELHVQWVKDMNAACDAFEILEKSRIEYIRNALWTFTNCISGRCVEEDQSFERIRQGLERIDPSFDLLQFVNSKRTGSDIPAPFEYKPGGNPDSDSGNSSPSKVGPRPVPNAFVQPQSQSQSPSQPPPPLPPAQESSLSTGSTIKKSGSMTSTKSTISTRPVSSFNPFEDDIAGPSSRAVSATPRQPPPTSVHPVQTAAATNPFFDDDFMPSFPALHQNNSSGQQVSNNNGSNENSAAPPPAYHQVTNPFF